VYTEDLIREGIERCNYNADTLVDIIMREETFDAPMDAIYDDQNGETVGEAVRRMKAWDYCHILDYAVDIVIERDKLGRHTRRSLVRKGRQS